jgi:hypothetical protein
VRRRQALHPQRWVALDLTFVDRGVESAHEHAEGVVDRLRCEPTLVHEFAEPRLNQRLVDRA